MLLPTLTKEHKHYYYDTLAASFHLNTDKSFSVDYQQVNLSEMQGKAIVSATSKLQMKYSLVRI